MDSSCFLYMQPLQYKFVFCCVYIQTLQYIGSYAPYFGLLYILFYSWHVFSVHVAFLNMFCIMHKEIQEKSSVHFLSLIDFLETKYMLKTNMIFSLRNSLFFRGKTGKTKCFAFQIFIQIKRLTTHMYLHR